MWDGDKGTAGEPEDQMLSAIGMNFYDAVCDDEIERAEALYRKCQSRAERLVEQIEEQERTAVDPVAA
jgi:hypothetical protein